jgi:hypothetical protein
MAERPVAGAALPLSLGFLTLGLGAFTAWLWPDGRVVPAVFFGFGLVASTVGVARLVDIIERR